MSITVIKLGGSLLGTDKLSDWLAAIEVYAKKQNIIIVPGGGIFADCVREQQQKLDYGDGVAHQQALLSMCQTGYLFKEYCPSLQIAENSGKLESLLNQHLPIIWLPYELLEVTQPHMQNWDFTSDSLALWLAGEIQTETLLMVKQFNEMPDNLLSTYIKNDILDQGIQLLIEEIECNIYVMNLHHIEHFSDPERWSSYRLDTD
ncbi:MAG: uridylate kinase [Pseudomonadota bacterium]